MVRDQKREIASPLGNTTMSADEINAERPTAIA